MTKINTILAERDTILAEGGSFSFVQNDNGVHYVVLDAVVEGQRFVFSQSTGVIAMVTKTGREARWSGRRAGMVRVRLDYAVDAERADSACWFGTGEHVGGWAPVGIFG